MLSEVISALSVTLPLYHCCFCPSNAAIERTHEHNGQTARRPNTIDNIGPSTKATRRQRGWGAAPLIRLWRPHSALDLRQDFAPPQTRVLWAVLQLLLRCAPYVAPLPYDTGGLQCNLTTNWDFDRCPGDRQSTYYIRSALKSRQSQHRQSRNNEMWRLRKRLM